MKTVIAIIALLLGVVHAQDKKMKISPTVEKAINRALRHLSGKQKSSGAWKGVYGENVGETSLCIMAFMSKGNLPGEGKYGHVVGKGVSRVLKQSQANGLIQNKKGKKQAPVMYGHALATLMLSEVWGQSRREDVGKVLRKAIDVILRAQGPLGGWSYQSQPKDGDTSICVMQLFALKSAQEAGIFVPDPVITKALRYIKKKYNKTERMFGYQTPKLNPQLYGSSAAGACIMQICKEKDRRFTRDPLNAHYELLKGGIDDKQGHKSYFLYYGSVAAFNAGPRTYKPWRILTEAWLIKNQKAEGGWGHYYQTAFCVLAATLPYHFIPIYQK